MEDLKQKDRKYEPDLEYIRNRRSKEKAQIELEALKADLIAEQVELEAMKAANYERQVAGHILAYDELAFSALSQQIRNIAEDIRALKELL